MVRPTTTRMKSPISNFKFRISIFLALTSVVHADLPRKAPLQTYSTLWNNSPFTSKPPVETGAPIANPLEDYSLIGISPIGGSKYRVTLVNKKKPDERKMVYSDDKDSEFKILGVTRKAGDPLGTVVSMQVGSQTGSVSFDEKLLTLAPPAAPRAAPVPGQLQPGQIPIPGQNPQLAPGAQRQPRPRVVPPPTPGQAPQPVQPVPQAGQSPMQQPQQQNTQQQERPERRRN